MLRWRGGCGRGTSGFTAGEGEGVGGYWRAGECCMRVMGRWQEDGRAGESTRSEGSEVSGTL